MTNENFYLAVVMKLVVISSPDRVKNELETLELLFDHGLEYFHLRKPDRSKSVYIKFIESVSGKYINRIIVHNYHELIEHYGSSSLSMIK